MFHNETDIAALTHFTKSYDPLLVALSIIIAIIAAFTAFGAAQQATSSKAKTSQVLWLCFGSFSLGLGIWAMHFVGMLSLTLPVPVNYDVGITLISILPGIAASAVVLWSMVNKLLGLKRIILSGMLLGLGVSAMHFIGMKGMEMDAMMGYDPVLLSIGVVLSIVFASIAMHFQVKACAKKQENIVNRNQITSSLIMGLSIASMHYMGMNATDFHPVQTHHILTGIDGASLGTMISFGVILVITVSFIIPTLLAVQYKHVATGLSREFESALARKQAITDSAYDAWVHINQQGEVLGWNKSAERTFGWTEQEAMGRQLSQLFIPQKHHQAHQQGMDYFLATGEGPVLNKVLELEAQHRDGHLFPVEVTITPISLGEHHEFSAFLRDISERKQTEKKQASLMRELSFEKNALDAHAIVSVTKVDGSLIYINEKFEKISQYTKAELIGQNHSIIKSDAHSPMFFMSMWESITKGQVWHGIIKNKAKDGSYYWVASTIVPFLNEAGVSIRYVSIQTDITAQKRLEEKYELAIDDALHQKKNAERANRAKSDFLASMSHELRTPLNAIIGFSQLIAADSVNPISKEHEEELGYILDSGKHLLSLINNVLDLAKIESGKSDLSLEEVKLQDVVTEAMGLMQALAEQKQVTIRLVAQHPELTLTSDYTKLKQVMINLISNAVKYNKVEGEVLVDYEKIDDETVRISVADEGVGIAEPDHHRVFSAFDRLGQETSNIEGTGVGLVITKEIVELMGGRIDFDKQKQIGATFNVIIPLNLGAVSKKDGNASFRGNSSLLADMQAKTNYILCIEDNPVNQQLMMAYFAKAPSLKAIYASSAEEAWDIIDQYPFDLVLMDINLPEMDGITLATKIRNLHSDIATIPIIAVSATSSEATIEHANGLFEAYVSKPVDFVILDELLREHLA